MQVNDITLTFKSVKKLRKNLKVYTYEEKYLRGNSPDPGEKLGIAAGAQMGFCNSCYYTILPGECTHILFL